MIENPDFENIRLISVKEFDFLTTHYSGGASKFKLYTIEKPYPLTFVSIVLFFFLVVSLIKNPINWQNTLILAIIIFIHLVIRCWKLFSTDIEVDRIQSKIKVKSKIWFGKYFYTKSIFDFSQIKKISSKAIEKDELNLRRIRLHTNKRNRIFIDLHESQDYNLFIASLENIIIKQKHKPNIVYQTN